MLNRELHKLYIDVLKKTDFPTKNPEKWRRFRTCCSRPKAKTNCTCGECIEIFFDRCKLSFCPLCAKINSTTRYKKAIQILRVLSELEDYHIFMVTFTIKTGTELQDRMKALNDSLRKMQTNNAFWKNFCVAGFRSLEVTRSQRKWHVHCHYLVVSRIDWIDENDLHKLKKYWLSITGDSHVINVKIIKDDKGIKEVFKYALKGSCFKPKDLYEYAMYSSKHRLYATTGIAYKWGKEKALELYKGMQEKVIFLLQKHRWSEDICPKCYNPCKWTVTKAMSSSISESGRKKMSQCKVFDGDGKPTKLTDAERNIIEEHTVKKAITENIITTKHVHAKSIKELQTIEKESAKRKADKQ